MNRGFTLGLAIAAGALFGCQRDEAALAMRACDALVKEGVARECTRVADSKRPQVAEVRFTLTTEPGAGSVFGARDEVPFEKIRDEVEVLKNRASTSAPHAYVVVWFDAKAKATAPRVSAALVDVR